jgi:tetratricopeptide (TPR) repeat protein
MKLFLSCVSSEFKSYRLKLANQLEALRGHSFEVKVQEDFKQEGFTLLELLADYIRGCDLVIHLAGDACGACPTPDHVQTFLSRLGDTPSVPLPDLSYTQWEYELARRFGRRTLIYLPSPDAPRDSGLPVRQSEQDARRQRAHIDRLDAAGAMRKAFAGLVPLVREVFYDLGLNPEECKVDNLPFKSIGSLFKGRDDFLRQIQAALGGVQHRGHRRAAAITASATAAAVHGLGGIGKTRAAIEYAQRHRDEYNALLFVRADSPTGLQSNFAALCGATVLDLAEKDERDIEAQVGTVLRWLQGHPGWFMILDNVDTEDAAKAVEELLARLSQAGHVLVTSRLGNWSGAVESLALDVLSEADAAAFLLERTKTGRRKGADDPDQARQVATGLGQLALALEQAGAYIVRNRLTFAQYRGEWTRCHDRVLEWFDERLMHYPASVAVTWQTTFDQLGEPARNLLRMFAWLAPDPIPEALLDTPLYDARQDEATSRDALADLEAYSLVTRDDESPVFSVHRLVQDVTRRSLRFDTDNKVLNRALNWINATFTGDTRHPSTWPIMRPLAPHASAVTDLADKAGIEYPTTFLMDRVATFLSSSKGDHAGAEPLYRRTLEVRERVLGLEHPDTLASVNNLAYLLESKGDYAGSEPLCRRALEARERVLGPEHPDTLVSVNNLALLLAGKGDYAGSEPLYRRALEVRERVLGPEHPDTLASVNNLAALMYQKGDCAGSEPLYRRALEVRERILGPEHPDTLTSVNNLAYLLERKDDCAGAEPLYRRALEAHERVLGPEHPTTLGNVQCLADLLDKTGRATQARPLRLRRLTVLAQKPDATPMQLRTCALDGYLLGDYVLAATLLRRVLAVGFEVPGTCCHLARIALLTDDLPAARQHADEAWTHRAEAAPYVVPRILWLQLATKIAEDGGQKTDDSEQKPEVGRQQEKVLGMFTSALQVEGAHREWTMQPVLDHLKPKLPAEDHALLTALVDALGDQTKVAALETIPAWRET